MWYRFGIYRTLYRLKIKQKLYASQGTAQNIMSTKDKPLSLLNWLVVNMRMALASYTFGRLIIIYLHKSFANLQYAHFLISEQQFRVLAFVECFVSFLCPLPAGCFYPSDARWCRLGPERQLYYFSRRKCYSKFVDIEAKLPKVYEIKEIYNIIKIIRYHKFSRTIYINCMIGYFLS